MCDLDLTWQAQADERANKLKDEPERKRREAYEQERKQLKQAGPVKAKLVDT